MNKGNKKRSNLKLIANITALLIFFGILFVAYRSCTKGYDKYAVFIQVKDEAIFEAQLDHSDSAPTYRFTGRKMLERFTAD